MSRSLSSALRPYLHTQVKPRRKDAYLRFYAAATAAAEVKPQASRDAKDWEARQHELDASNLVSLWNPSGFRKRLKQLTATHPEGQNAPTHDLYPRTDTKWRITPAQFNKRAEKLNIEPGSWARKERHAVRGKIHRIRAMGSKLLFIDLVEDEQRVQVMIDKNVLEKKGAYSTAELADMRKRMAAGDVYGFEGVVHRTQSGQLTLAVEEMPKLLAPSLHTLPREVTDKETLARLPQLDLLTHQKRRDLLRLRHVVEKSISDFLDERDFTKVTTPILAADTGGAAAQPFETSTNELPDIPLRLRIAPELGLKKLVAAGLGAVYEIGPCFRNEGLDATHNPEFTTCEFYKPHASLDELMNMTEDMLREMAGRTKIAVHDKLTSLGHDDPARPWNSHLQSYLFDSPKRSKFRSLAFIPTLLEQIRTHIPMYRLPRILDESAADEVADLIHNLQTVSPDLDMKVPANPTTARLLDYLCSRFVEPLCKAPTFITDHPAVMAPLAKSYVDGKTGYVLSARAELFINGVEYVNLYEEENNPFIQAQNFLLQSTTTPQGQHASQTQSLSNPLKNEFGHDLTHEEVKKRLSPAQQYYVRCLEMGLPPTGGWGCGIERLVMLFGGAARIGEVLAFGGLRSVVAMGTAKDSKTR